MPRPRLSPEERKERRREAALKGARTRAARTAATPDLSDPGPVAGPTTRQLMERARQCGREADFWRRVHELRLPSRPAQWNSRQLLALAAAIELWEAER